MWVIIVDKIWSFSWNFFTQRSIELRKTAKKAIRRGFVVEWSTRRGEEKVQEKNRLTWARSKYSDKEYFKCRSCFSEKS